MRLCKINGIQINLHATWFIAFGLITWALSKGYFPRIAPELIMMQHWLLGIVSTLLMFISILFHEMAHTVMAMRHNVPVDNITLHIFGGVARYRQEISSPMNELVVSLAGPVMSLFMAIGFMLLKVPYVSDYLIEMNLIIAGFNMLPVFPMDGGRVLRDVLWMLSGKYLRSTERAVKFGLACAKLFVAIGILSIITKTFGMGIWLLFIGVFVHVLGSHYGRQVRNSDALSGIVGTFMIPDRDVIKIHYEMTVKEFYKYFLTYGFHCYPVINDSKRVIGMVTYWHMKKNCRNDNDKVKDYMQPVLQGNAITVSKETDMVSAYEKMLFSNMSRLFVYDGDTFSGLITRSTVLRILGESHVM